MSSKNKELTPADLEKPYEENDIRLRGILIFLGGLLGLILITFGLMWFFLDTMKDYSKTAEGPANPMARSDIERLPPEPRLQLAPGFGVDGPNGRVNLELQPPASEWHEVRKEWNEMELNGEKDPKTGVVVMLPIEEAKKRFLDEAVKARSDDDAKKLYDDSRRFYSESSAGRAETETRR